MLRRRKAFKCLTMPTTIQLPGLQVPQSITQRRVDLIQPSRTPYPRIHVWPRINILVHFPRTLTLFSTPKLSHPFPIDHTINPSVQSSSETQSNNLSSCVGQSDVPVLNLSMGHIITLFGAVLQLFL